VTDIPLAGFSADRAAHRRRDRAWLEAAFAGEAARILLLREGAPLVEGSQGQQGPRALQWFGPQAAMLATSAKRLFLGVDEKSAPMFALDLPASFSLSSSPIAGLGVFEEVRMALSAMSAFDMGAVATARAIFEWHMRNGFCANCGHATDIEEAGWKRRCPDCGAEHFPRVDPVAIMLATVNDKCLLGRQAAWRPGMWSALAGFVEPGESFEMAAARELFEEAGVRTRVGGARYLFGQPWPFPYSLMIGVILEAESEDLKVDTSEIETARWFTRAEIADVMAGKHPEVSAPHKLAVAHYLIKAWLEG
jgi:NAD+ diphosphatase